MARRRSSNSTVTTTLKWMAIVAVIVGGIYGLVRLAGNGGDSDLPALPLDHPAESDWVKGNAEGSVTLIEFGDFQCPACRAYAGSVAQIADEFGDRVAVVYRHYPLGRIHLNANAAARAAEAAGLQGKFWEMHDMLFERQTEWSRGNPNDLFRFYAEQLELDLERFEQDMESDVVDDAVRQDERSAIAAGAQGTPTFVLNGNRIQNPPNHDEFRLLILGALADAGAPDHDDASSEEDEAQE